MKCLIIIFLTFYTTDSISQDWTAKIDPLLFSMYSRIYEPLEEPLYDQDDNQIGLLPAAKLWLREQNSDQIIRAFLLSTNSIAELEACGITIQSQIENIFTAHIPLSNLPVIAQLDGVEAIQMGLKVEIELDESANAIRASEARNAFNVNGNNVIVGILDTGIDITHQDFRNNDGTTRILYIWDQTDQIGPSPSSFNYGTEWNAASINNGTCRQTDVAGHGTHVAGIAAGNGRATGNNQPAGTYVGIAPEANIIVVKLDFDNTANIIDGLLWLAAKAVDLNRPWVANLSLGTSFGPHDGTSLFEKAIFGVTNQSESKGRIIVKSGGNSGYNPNNPNSNVNARIHMSGTGNSNATFTVNSTINSTEEYTWLQLWYPQSDNYSITLTAPDGTDYGPYSRGSGTGQPNYGYITNDGFVYVHNENWNAQSSKRLYYPLTPDNMIEIFIGDEDYNGVHYPLRNGNWIISMASSSGRWDAYILGATSSGGIYFAANSYENARIITEPGNAYRVLTVGSFNSKNTWISANGQNQNQVGYTLNEITYFSSPGPTRDGRNKPDVYAPGAWISSSRSTSFTPNAYQISRDGVHYHMQGTSFAAPHLTGAVALLLEQDNNYTFEDIIDILNETKTSEGYLDIYEALFLNFENPTSPLEPSKIYSEPTLLLNRETYFFNVSPAWDRRKK